MSVSENEKVWIVFCDPDLFGPLSVVEIKIFLSEGKIKDDDCLWKKGWKKWKQPKDVPVFAYECKKSMGTERPVPELAIPDSEDFKSIISPKVSAAELDTGKNWDARRIAIVAGSTLLAGVPGAVVAGVLSKKKEGVVLEKAAKHIDEKNK